MKKTLGYFRAYIPYILLLLAFLFGQAMCELALPGYMSDIINRGIITSDQDYIYATGFRMLLVSAASVLFAVGAGFIAARTASSAAKDARADLFKRITSFSRNEFTKFESASLITRTTNDIQTVQQTSIMVMRMAFYAPIMGIGALTKALSTSPSLTWTIAISLVCILLIMVVMFLAVMPKFRVMQSRLDRLNQIVGERLSGLLVVRAFNSQSYEEKRFEKANRELTSIGIFVNRAMSLLFPALMLIMNLTGVLIIWVGADLIDSRDIMVGDVMAFLQYSMQILISFLVITMMFIMIPRATVSAGRIGEVLSVEPSIKDSENPVVPENITGHIEFRNVSFSYPGAAEKTLENVSFHAEPGQTTAIIGSTGSGKSTVVNLIPRFFDVTEGAVLLDGTDIRDIPQKVLRDSIGTVPQKGLLFSGTIRSNMQYGKKDATDDEIYEALATAQAMDFVSEMPEGLDTPVSQGGTSVSGGQKQRLSIARALVKKPPIYLFDDSFSALDFKTDRNLRAALKDKVGDSTFIIVAQRINTIMDADRIIVLDEGKIAGTGTHSQLLKNCEVYRQIAISQLSPEELEGGVTHGGK